MLNDLRYALRTLFKNPGFAVVAILTLALGIGANTAIFSVVNGVLLRPLPYPDAGTIVQVWTTSPGEPKSSHAAADFLEFQRDNRTLLKIAGYREDALTISAAGGEPVRVQGDLVTLDYFDVFGMPAQLGRTFSRAADGTTNEPLVVLSHAIWTGQFASDPQTVNKRVRINGVPHTVVGVMPAVLRLSRRREGLGAVAESRAAPADRRHRRSAGEPRRALFPGGRASPAGRHAGAGARGSRRAGGRPGAAVSRKQRRTRRRHPAAAREDRRRRSRCVVDAAGRRWASCS